MNKETEMYHAAIKILENRAEQLGDDELIHTARNVTIQNKYGYYVPQEDIDRIIDSKINSMPSDISNVLRELNDSDKFNNSLMGENSLWIPSAVRDGKEITAARRLWKKYVNKITKDVKSEMDAKGYRYSGDIEQMVINRFWLKYPRAESLLSSSFGMDYYLPKYESLKDKATRKLNEKSHNDDLARSNSRRLIERAMSDKAGARREREEAARNNRVAAISRTNKRIRDINSKR